MVTIIDENGANFSVDERQVRYLSWPQWSKGGGVPGIFLLGLLAAGALGRHAWSLLACVAKLGFRWNVEPPPSPLVSFRRTRD